MGYERNDRGYGNAGERGNFGGDRGRYGYRGPDAGRGDYGTYGGYGSRDYRGERFNDRSDSRDYGRAPSGYDYQDRGFVDRAGDEVRSWFGDEDAERRRREDERRDERYRDDNRGDYSAGSYGNSAYGGGYGRDYGASNYGRDAQRHDPNYAQWRDRQMQALDRDYHEYRQENQSRFDTEFHSWRQGRQGQRDLLTKVQEHQEVVGSDGQHVGKVDHVRGDRIELTKSDKDAGGHHHVIPSSWVASVDDKVTLNKTADQAKQQWREQGRDAFGWQNDEQSGNRNLNRSFSGTY
ncbi:DUF2171 domain-containing protein [Sphingomonas nostoxanthinifaciens]|uniref:DUF2171 domain-containing protein n=1 Tax=Sphingomonas nostoxanthinifaciens TaxID=2872652 RepID=UPI001CC1F3F6|nr:DUF2171 domain-containing protein [Sphingomonas nostoxanthinifaciens]UAK24093.1 DUF2171 domain-containing protein [Sphingomonas nostoxanthinifaciens]